jgi:hypothetical protein
MLYPIELGVLGVFPIGKTLFSILVARALKNSNKNSSARETCQAPVVSDGVGTPFAPFSRMGGRGRQFGTNRGRCETTLKKARPAFDVHPKRGLAARAAALVRAIWNAIIPLRERRGT